MVTGVEVVTDPVVTVNIALASPAVTVTLAGTVAAALLLERETDAPPPGASWFSVTVPVEDAPPLTLPGLSIIEYSAGGPGPPPPPYPPPQEYANSVSATTAVETAPLGCRARTHPSEQIPRNAASHASHKFPEGHENRGSEIRGKLSGTAVFLAVVVKVTVAVAVSVPSSVTIEGETLQVAPVGAPVQLQVTV
jgi:hypothetical protein